MPAPAHTRSSVFFALALVGCQGQGSPAAPSPEPYWLTKPTLPSRPQDFCPTVAEVLGNTFKGEDVHCKDTTSGDFGVRAKRSGSEVVILQGANEEWVAFAYLVEGAAPTATPLDASILADLVSNVEAAVRD